MVEQVIKKKKQTFGAKARQDAEKAIANFNKPMDQAMATAKEGTALEEKLLDDKYADIYRRNAIQEEYNKQRLAENMANAGLTDSGLNRSQMTAITLNRGRRDTEADMAKDRQVFALKQQLRDYMGKIEADKARFAADQYARADQATTEYEERMLRAANSGSSRGGGGGKGGGLHLSFNETEKVYGKLQDYAKAKDYTGMEDYIEFLVMNGYLEREEAFRLLDRYHPDERADDDGYRMVTSQTGQKRRPKATEAQEEWAKRKGILFD